MASVMLKTLDGRYQTSRICKSGLSLSGVGLAWGGLHKIRAYIVPDSILGFGVSISPQENNYSKYKGPPHYAGGLGSCLVHVR